MWTKTRENTWLLANDEAGVEVSADKHMRMVLGAVECSEEKIFEEISKPTVSMVLVYADWCAPCNAFKPVFKQFAQQNPEIVCMLLNVDKSNGDFLDYYRVASVPTLLLFAEDAYVIIKSRTIEGILYEIKEYL